MVETGHNAVQFGGVELLEKSNLRETAAIRLDV